MIAAGGPWLRPQRNVVCRHCGKEFNANKNSLFCSQACSEQHLDWGYVDVDTTLAIVEKHVKPLVERIKMLEEMIDKERRLREKARRRYRRAFGVRPV